jgi:asparagine synthase (glutamine-hydrolysing)
VVELDPRAPFLDQVVVPVAMSIPDELGVRHGSGMGVLQSVLARQMPRDLLARPKMGLAEPLGAPLRVRFQRWVGDVLQSSARGQLLVESILGLWLDDRSGWVDCGGSLRPMPLIEAYVAQDPDAAVRDLPSAELAAICLRDTLR